MLLQVNSTEIVIPGYDAYFQPTITHRSQGRKSGRRNARRQTAIYIDKTIPHIEVIDLSRWCNDHQEVVGVRTRFSKRALLLVSVYVRPRRTGRARENWDWIYYIQSAYSSDIIVIAGDFNARHQTWGYAENHYRGKTLRDVIAANYMELLNDPDIPTRYGHGRQGGTTPDLTWGSPNARTDWEVSMDAMGSDHFPILVTLKNLRFALYADDIALWSVAGFGGEQEHTLQRGLDEVQRFLEEVGMTASPEKTEFVVVLSGPQREAEKTRNLYTLNLAGKPIKRSSTIRVLGLFIGQDGKAGTWMARVKKEGRQILHLFRQVTSRSQDTRLREAGVEAVYCLARGAPKGPNIPRAQLNHQGPLFPGHGYATHSQTWVGEPTWLGVRSDATHQAPTKVGAPCVRVWWPTWLGSVVTQLTKHLAPKVQAPPAGLGVRGDATLQTPAFTGAPCGEKFGRVGRWSHSSPQGASITADLTKYHHVVSSQPPAAASEIRNLLFSPPVEGAYSTLKRTLIRQVSPSKLQRLEQLLREADLGD
ncbi:uncharacterized protein ISCGN_018972 [Ixodes scapularis]